MSMLRCQKRLVSWWIGESMLMKKIQNSWWSPHTSYLSFFLHLSNFWLNFLHAKVRKSRQNGFRKNSVIRHKTDFTTTKQGKFLISSHLSCGDMWNSSKFGKNSHFSASIVWKKLKFLCMWRNLRFLHICHVLKSEIFSTWLIFLHLYIGDRGDKYEVWVKDCCQVHHTSKKRKSLRSLLPSPKYFAEKVRKSQQQKQRKTEKK